ncbi:MAG: contact-dependent growth inhibition system immunity protein [Bacteroidota bacterium]
MKFEANWKFKSLDSLEKDKWGSPEYDSYLVKTVHQLRSVPLNEYQIEDLRIMISQNIGLKFLIPLALEQLEKNLFAEGDFYEGDLLQATLNADSDFWQLNPQIWAQLNNMISKRLGELDTEKINYAEFQNLNLGT